MSKIVIVPKNLGGVIAQAAITNYLTKQYKVAAEQITFIEVTPALLGSCVIPEKGDIFILGFGLHNCARQHLSAIAKACHKRIILWVDFHPKNDQIEELSTKPYYRHFSRDNHSSLIAALYKLWGSKVVDPEWVVAANCLENPLNCASKLADKLKKMQDKLADDTKTLTVKARSEMLSAVRGYKHETKVIPINQQPQEKRMAEG